MAEPFNYMLNVPSPQQSFAQGLQIGSEFQQAQLRRDKAMAERDRAQRKAAAFARLGPNATYEDYTAVIAEMPEEAEALGSFYKTVSEAKRNALMNAGSNAWMRLRPGPDGTVDPTAAVSELETAAMAFENSGDKESARQLRDAAMYVKQDPKNGAAVIGTVMTVADPERAKAVMGASQDTAFQRDYAFIKERDGEEAAKLFMEGRYDPLVSIPLPGGRVYFGPRSGMASQMGATPQTQVIDGKTYYNVNGKWFDNPEGR